MGNNVNSLIPFTYLVTSSSLALNAAGTFNLQIQQDSSFILSAILGSSSQQDPTDYSPNEFTCLITDQTTGRQLMSSALDQRLLCGDAYRSVLQRQPVEFLPNSNLSFQITNLNASANVIKIALMGFKQFV